MLDEVSARTGLTFKIAAESNSFEMLRGLVIHAGLISFQIKIGTLPAGNKLGVIAREIDGRDVPRANLVLGRLRGRTLPIATAVFAERLTRQLEAMRTPGMTNAGHSPHPGRKSSAGAQRSGKIGVLAEPDRVAARLVLQPHPKKNGNPNVTAVDQAH